LDNTIIKRLMVCWL